MVELVTDPNHIATWNRKATHPMQSWGWGEARYKMGIDVVRIGEFENNELKNVFQLTIHPISNLPFALGYIPRSVFPSREVMNFLYEYGKKHNLIYIKIEPNVKKDTKLELHSTRLQKSAAPLFPEWTQVIDLTPTEDELLKKMKQKTRYNIKLAQKKGVTVKEVTTDEGFETFIKLYFETTKRQHYAGHNHHYHKTIFQTLKKSISHILIAYFENTPIAAYHLFTFNDVLYYPYGGSSDKHRDTMGANLMMWEAIRFGKQQGCKSFDLWGSLAPDFKENNIWAGFTRFKSGYGSEFVQMAGSYDLVTNSLLYKPTIWAQKLRDKLLGL